ncbi:MAG TPA: CmcI family methyltransferase [Flavitalea sp.]|nr:CmcI family methyltransferase [Flavitalea sp.]
MNLSNPEFSLSKWIIKAFHKLYYNNSSQTWDNTYWMGTKILKCPLDMWIYQEIFYELKPDLVIECGTNRGGSASFMAALFDLIGNGRILTIDIQEFENRPQHPRVEYLLGSTIDAPIVEKVRSSIKPGEKVLVILDSDHADKHVYQEMNIYHQFVTSGSYMIVEDSNVHGHPVHKHHGPGPFESIERFLKHNNDFTIDRTREKFMLTFNPTGYLKKR